MPRKIFDMGRNLGMKDAISERLFPREQEFGVPNTYLERLLGQPKGIRVPDIECEMPDGIKVTLKDVVVKPTRKQGLVNCTFQVAPEHLKYFYPKVITLPLDGTIPPTEEAEGGGKEER